MNTKVIFILSQKLGDTLRNIALHLETFLFMTILSPNQLPPPDIPRPDFEALARDAERKRVENKWFTIPEQTLTIGFNDPETDDGENRFFAWDNEREPYDVKVPTFEAQARPISIGEYAEYLFNTGTTQTIPISWSCENALGGNAKPPESLKSFIDQHTFRTVWGPIPLSQALDWPLVASYNEVARYAQWAGASIPTLHQVRSIHEYAERLRKRALDKTCAAPESSINKKLHTDPEAIFVDLSGRNVGFSNFHPTSVTHRGDHLCGLCDLGGAGEWSSDLFAPQPGFKPMDIYPGYSGM